jgi:hypothetical protein
MPTETAQAVLAGADAARYMRLWILFAVTQFPVTIALVGTIATASGRTYWWVAVPLAAEAVPGAVYWRIRRFTRTRLARSSA